MATSDAKYIEIPDESDLIDDYSDDDLYNIESWGADLSFRELITMYDEDELLKPELQRHYVWEKIDASRFIESLLLGLPVPSIFLAKQTDEKRLIIDGYQRIMSVYEYVVKRIFSKDGKTFRLSNSPRINEKWRGKSFDELSDTDRRKIKSTTIHAIIFQQKEPKNDDTSLFQIFERINTSGRSLTAQEIRNCVYQGQMNSLLIELNSCINWRSLYGSKNPDSRMKDAEFILRFFTLFSFNPTSSSVARISLKKALNDFMGDHTENTLESINKKREVFHTTIDFILDYMGNDAFFNITDQGKIIAKLHPTIFDSIAVATSRYLESGQTIPTDLKERRKNLLTDEEFKIYTSVRTTDVEHIEGRIRKAMQYLYGAST
jgi:hypothetical protein